MCWCRDNIYKLCIDNINVIMNITFRYLCEDINLFIVIGILEKYSKSFDIYFM